MSSAPMDVNFSKWGRPFKFITEVYYKYLWDVNPYDIENVKIRYYGDNVAKAFATGIDFRVSGEFIPGDESWFSLGFLSTKEDLDSDNRGYIARPSDQRVNAAIFFSGSYPEHAELQSASQVAVFNWIAIFSTTQSGFEKFVSWSIIPAHRHWIF